MRKREVWAADRPYICAVEACEEPAAFRFSLRMEPSGAGYGNKAYVHFPLCGRHAIHAHGFINVTASEPMWSNS